MPQVDVAPESLTPYGIVPFTTPSFTLSSSVSASSLEIDESMDDEMLLISSSKLSISSSFSATSDASSLPICWRSDSVITLVFALKMPSL